MVLESLIHLVGPFAICICILVSYMILAGKLSNFIKQRKTES